MQDHNTRDENFEENHKAHAVDHTRNHDVLKEIKTQPVLLLLMDTTF
jgi:hypothetical protein